MDKKRIVSPWLILNYENRPRKCILMLPGRSGHAFDHGLGYANQAQINPDTLFVSVTPENLEWYPLPNGPTDQSNSIEGILQSVIGLVDVIEKIYQLFMIEPKHIALAGFSAGGVMAIQLAMKTQLDFAAVVCHSGAILSPDEILMNESPLKISRTPYLLVHAKDDIVFKWDERYLPMKKTLLNNKYNVQSVEANEGGHRVGEDSIVNAIEFMEYHLDTRQAILKGKPEWMIQNTTQVEAL